MACRADGRGKFFYMPRIRGFNGGATGEAAVPTERGPVSTWSWFSMPHTDCGAKYCNQFKGDVGGGNVQLTAGPCMPGNDCICVDKQQSSYWLCLLKHVFVCILCILADFCHICSFSMHGATAERMATNYACC